MIKEFWIYKITNVITNKIYIGQTNSLYNRLKSHKACRDKDTIIVKSIQKYGWENHKVEILFTSKNVTREDADIIEKHYIKTNNSYIINNKLGMNLTEGGYGGKLYKKKKIANPKKWKIKLGKEDVDIVLLNMEGKLVDRLNAHRKNKQEIPILDLNTGIYFETMTEFCEQEQRCFATIRERFEKGKYVGKYMMCKN